MDHERPRELKGTGYELFILLLSILSVVNTVLVFLPLGVVAEVAFAIETLVTPIFLIDFAFRLLTAASKTDYVMRRWGWADLLASVPLLRIFRMFRIVRVMRLLRAYGAHRIVRDLELDRPSATFYITMFLVILVVEVAGVAVYYTESRVPGASIRSAGDAIWWGLVTITTVGYGDVVPVTAAGRVVGVFLLFAGIALFSVLTGFIANAFLTPHRRAGQGTPAVTTEAELAELRRLLGEQETTAAALRATLERLERRMARQVAGGEPSHPAASSAAASSPGSP
jgi:voltage-gated potassium channel